MTSSVRAIVLIAISTGATATAVADVIFVPDTYATIQEAVDVAVDGDSVVVSAGLYPEVVVVSSKHIDLVSISGADATTSSSVKRSTYTRTRSAMRRSPSGATSGTGRSGTTMS